MITNTDVLLWPIVSLNKLGVNGFILAVPGAILGYLLALVAPILAIVISMYIAGVMTFKNTLYSKQAYLMVVTFEGAIIGALLRWVISTIL